MMFYYDGNREYVFHTSSSDWFSVFFPQNQNHKLQVFFLSSNSFLQLKFNLVFNRANSTLIPDPSMPVGGCISAHQYFHLFCAPDTQSAVRDALLVLLYFPAIFPSCLVIIINPIQVINRISANGVTRAVWGVPCFYVLQLCRPDMALKMRIMLRIYHMCDTIFSMLSGDLSKFSTGTDSDLSGDTGY